jgi:hypothetical protein
MVMSSRASSSPSAGRSERSATDVVIASILVAACIVLALMLGACKNVLNDDEEDDSFQMRMVNLIEDSATVQYSIDSTAVNSAGYLAATGFSAGHPGERTVSFSVLRPASLVSSDTTDPIPIGGSFSQSYVQGRDYTVLAYGTMSDPRTILMDEQSERDDVADDFIEYQFINVAPNVPSVDVYITAPEGQVTSPEKVATVGLGTKSTPTTLKLFRRPDVTDTDAALIVDFSIELRDPTTGNVLFKSGELRLTEQTRLLWAIANNTGPGPSRLKLVGVDGTSGSVLSTDDQGAVRVVHVSADSTAFDIYRGSSLTTPVAQNVAFRDHSPYVHVPVGEVDLIALPAGSTSVVIVFVEEFASISNASFSAYTVGNQGFVDAIVLTDDRRSIPTQSKFRFFHAAPSLDGEDALNVYVTLPDQSLDFTSSTTDTNDDASRFLRGSMGYRDVTAEPVILKSGTYRVRMAPVGTSRIELDATITVQDGSVQTYVLIDDPETAELELMPVEEALVQ